MSRLSAAIRRLLRRPPAAPILHRDGSRVRLRHAYYGPLCVLTNDSSIAGHLLDGQTIWESHIVTLFREIFPHGRNVVDLGANLGLHTIALAKMATRGERVFAFEPHPDIFPLLAENCRPHPQITCFNKAASDKPATLYMRSVLDATNAGNARVSGDNAGDAHPVEAATIDSLNLPDVGLMKIDVEGHEMAAIAGAVETIRRHRPTLVVEIMGGESLDTADAVTANVIHSSINRICDLGYSVERLDVHNYLFRPTTHGMP